MDTQVGRDLGKTRRLGIVSPLREAGIKPGLLHQFERVVESCGYTPHRNTLLNRLAYNWPCRFKSCRVHQFVG